MIFLALLFFGNSCFPQSGDPVHSLAILYSSGNQTVLSPLFLKEDSHWSQSRANQDDRNLSLRPVPYTITFDGRLIAKTRETFVALKKPMVVTLDRNIRFPKFDGLDKFANIRPYIAISSPVFSDPENWKVGTPPESIISKVKSEWSRHLKPEIFEVGSKSAKIKNLTSIPPESLTVKKSYRDNSGQWLVSVIADKKTSAPPGWQWNESDSDAGAMGTNWFHVGTSGKVHFLRDGSLIDIGDYDADGKSEYIFYEGPVDDGSSLGLFRLVESDLKTMESAGLKSLAPQ